MSRKETATNSRKLVERLTCDVERHGSVLGILGTSYEFHSDFFELDLLPSVLGLGAWDDHSWASRIALERQLGILTGTVMFTDAHCYRTRPRSLHVEFLPISLGAEGILHAKVLLIIHERAVKVFVGSANLTGQGFRQNREVIVPLLATPESTEQAPLIRQALSGLQGSLAGKLKETASRLLELAAALLDEWKAPQSSLGADEQFLWSDRESPLWRQVLNQWPKGEAATRVTIVSPFWTDQIQSNPVELFLRSIRERGDLAESASVRLLTEANQIPDGSWQPLLPPAFAHLDGRKLYAKVTAEAVSPMVTSDEVGGRKDFSGTRKLHAKILLMEGPQTSLAYIGSANFTNRGWGFVAHQANVEAGLILRRQGKDRTRLAEIIPQTVGIPVVLDGAAGTRLSPAVKEMVQCPWPIFLDEAVLVESGTHESLNLLLRFTAAVKNIDWRVHLVRDSEFAGDLLTASHLSVGELVSVSLAPETLRQLLIHQEVMVVWDSGSQRARFPINVEGAARHRLPVTPNEGPISEAQLLDYYQGKISFEELFPDPIDTSIGDRGEGDTVEAAGVDTSGIQSYVIREFVEALRGINQGLGACTTTEACMKMALFGPVSLIALARSIAKSVEERKRTATAGAFQLAEIYSCILMARSVLSPSTLREAWDTCLSKATREVSELLDKVQAFEPRHFGPQSDFMNYHSTLQQHYGVKRMPK